MLPFVVIYFINLLAGLFPTFLLQEKNPTQEPPLCQCLHEASWEKECLVFEEQGGWLEGAEAVWREVLVSPQVMWVWQSELSALISRT